MGLALKLHVALGGIAHRPLESLYSAQTFRVGSKLTNSASRLGFWADVGMSAARRRSCSLPPSLPVNSCAATRRTRRLIGTVSELSTLPGHTYTLLFKCACHCLVNGGMDPCPGRLSSLPGVKGVFKDLRRGSRSENSLASWPGQVSVPPSLEKESA